MTPLPFPVLYWIMRARRRAGTLALALGVLGVPTVSTPQEEPSQTRYDFMYGTPVDVSVDAALSACILVD